MASRLGVLIIPFICMMGADPIFAQSDLALSRRMWNKSILWPGPFDFYGVDWRR